MLHSRLSYFVAGALAATVLVSVPAAALVDTATVDPKPSTYDGTTPSFTLSPIEFVLGASIDAAGPFGGDVCDTAENYSIPLRMRWSASDATSGVAGYDVWRGLYDGNAKVVADTTATSYQFWGHNWENRCGGGDNPGYTKTWVVARDNRGNSATSIAYGERVGVWAEAGERSLPATRTGTWTTAKCTCFNNGQTIYSTKAGASVTYKVPAVERPGQTLALVVEKNSNRGRMNVSVDGGTATSVDTYASTATHRVIVWQKALGAGSHTIKITNAGTTGRSRVDIDSLMLYRGETAAAPEPSP